MSLALVIVMAPASLGAMETSATPFKLIVLPGEGGFPGDTFVGQRCKFLVVVDPSVEGWRGMADISATAPGAVVKVRPARVSPGLVAEVTVIPNATDTERQITVTIIVKHGGVSHKEARTLTVWPEKAQQRAWAASIRDRFVAWLETEFPELGITSDTVFAGTVARPHWLIVSRFLFFTSEWEIGVEWHVMVEPDDWAHLYLRHRWSDTEPTFAAEITSVQRGDTPHAIAPSPELYR
jgi:hypothetical protein